jgi:MFS family permease
MTPIYASLILIAILALGDYISIITKAKVPMLFVCLFGYLILIWSGMPKDLISISTLGPLGGMLVPVLIVHMGTLIPFNQIKEQWRSIVVALIGLVIAGGFILLIISPIFGYNKAVAGCAPVLGGIIAALVTADGLKAAGHPELLVIAMAILGIQGLVGMPIASNILKKYVVSIKEKIKRGEITSDSVSKKKAAAEEIQYGTDENPSPKYRALLPKKFEVDTIMLFKLLIGGALAFFLGKITPISNSIWALFIGMTGAYFGIYRGKMLNRANSFGLAMAALIILVLGSMNNVTFKLFTTQLPAILSILAIGTIGLLLGGVIGAKIVKWPKELSIPVVLTAEFGFPGNYLISDEVARSTGSNKKERDIIMDKILPPMLVGGYTTVTITSIIIASILIKTLH